MKRTRIATIVMAGLFIGVGATGADTAAKPSALTAAPSSIVSVAREMFGVNPFLGGQVAPRFYTWVNDRVLVFMKFDRPRLDEAKALRYIGIGVRGTFCAETQPGGPKGGFTHFHRLNAPVYAQGHGGPPGTEGYWLMWVSVDNFDAADGRTIRPRRRLRLLTDTAAELRRNADAQLCGSRRARTHEGRDQAVGGRVLRQSVPRRSARPAALPLDHRRHARLPPVRQGRPGQGAGAALRRGRQARGLLQRRPWPERLHELPGADLPYGRERPRREGRPDRALAPRGRTQRLQDAVGQRDARRRSGVLDDARHRLPKSVGGSQPVAAEIKLQSEPGNPDRPFAFQPGNVTVPAGSTVRWVNAENMFHTVTSTDSLAVRRPNGLFDKSLVKKGDTFEYTFTKPGVYHYYCQPHTEFMWGGVTVTG